MEIPQELIDSLEAQEYGDIRSILDEHFFIDERPSIDTIATLLELTENYNIGAEFSFSTEIGWTYEEID